jgi:GT2 family glycosyltransferase
MADFISVIVATYNREDALAQVLRSLAYQGERDFEILVADDGRAPEPIASFSTATASRGPTSSPRIAGSPSSAAS